MAKHSVKINYIDGLWNNGYDSGFLKKKIDELAECVKNKLDNNNHFVKLLYDGEKEYETYYYNFKINAILGSLEILKWCGSCSVQEQLQYHNDNKSANSKSLRMQVLRKEEYETLDIDGVWKQYESLICDEFIGKRIVTLETTSQEGMDQFKFVGDKEFQEKFLGEVLLIPVYRCKEEMGVDEKPDYWQLTQALLKKGFYPLYADNENLEIEKEFLREWRNWRKEQEKYGIRSTDEKWEAEKCILEAGEKDVENIKKYYCYRPVKTAMIPAYDKNIFQMNRGAWDLWRYAEITKEKIADTRRYWYDISKYDIYARNPCLDIASDIEVAAIDFGTKNTTVAIYDRQGRTTLIPIGEWDDSQPFEKRFENPTTLKFSHTEDFLKEYCAKECQPDTKIDDISVSHLAEEDLYKWDNKKNMMQYQDHLKQWANMQDSRTRIKDGDGKVYNLCGSGCKDTKIDPIEIYAYYIGLYLNNMKTGKIYLKYLLSFSSTYVKASCEQIRKSFEKGLKKSFPREICEDAEIMKRFEVKLWRDEATGYAVCAADTYLNSEYIMEERGKILECSSGNDNFIYGVYDFGGGTLDFSYGECSRDEKGVRIFKTIATGGSSSLGCENILEELTYKIFDDNQYVLNKKKIKCINPFHIRTIDGGEIVSDSLEARRNTRQVLNILKECWMHPGENIIDDHLEFKLMSEDGQEYSIGKGKDVPQIIEEKEVEDFFKESIKRGVELFIKKYEGIIAEYRKKGVIFLAGNASRSSRVKECFDKYFDICGNKYNFCLVDALAVENGPTAKTGVVYGLLLSRPSAEFVKIRIKEGIECPDFLYHIGYEKIKPDDGTRRFHLALCADKVPLHTQKYHILRKIPQEKFELMYTMDYRYAVAEDSLLGMGIYVTQISVPKWAVGQYLFCRAEQDSVHKMYLGVSNRNTDESRSVTVIGYCDFQSSGNVFQRIEGVSEKKETSLKAAHGGYSWQ